MELHVGDVVRLKSGGPEMTVIDYPINIVGGGVNPQLAKCQWFNNDNKLSVHTFDIDALEKAE